ncbi:MAG: molybdopterin molybdotransferase MoeA [Planctomycetes bacterium]|nr:molybdopterin molybdotransferase MoeA [Planctomycetota bacterium]
MLRVEEALARVAAAAGAPSRRVERVALPDALGRVLAADVAIDHDVPPFPRAMMDGFAVRAADVLGPTAELAVVGRVLAGASFPRALAPGEAVAIMTGAPVPDGADAVVPVERSVPAAGPRGAETRVRLEGPARAGHHVARRAEQVAQGAVVARAGVTLSPARLGVLAAAGCASVPVAAAPRVAVVCTGDELVPVASRPAPSQIRDSNGHTLVAQARRAGATARYDGPVRDDPAALRAAILAALDADVVCLSGGVSMGEKDLVPDLLVACGVEPVFHRWAVKPGGPLWFGRRGTTLVFGLPGNPSASFVGFELLVVPALRTRLGVPFAPRATVPAKPRGAFPAPTARRHYVPVALDVAPGPVPCLVAEPVAWKGSGDPFGLAAATGLAVVLETGAPPPPSCGHEGHPAAAGPLDAAGHVDVVPLHGLPWGAP